MSDVTKKAAAAFVAATIALSPMSGACELQYCRGPMPKYLCAAIRAAANAALNRRAADDGGAQHLCIRHEQMTAMCSVCSDRCGSRWHPRPGQLGLIATESRQ